jgi:hypothetical protein
VAREQLSNQGEKRENEITRDSARFGTRVPGVRGPFREAYRRLQGRILRVLRLVD